MASRVVDVVLVIPEAKLLVDWRMLGVPDCGGSPKLALIDQGLVSFIIFYMYDSVTPSYAFTGFARFISF